MESTGGSKHLIDVDVPWVVIPLPHDEALNIHLWIKRWYPSLEEDNALATDCEKAIKAAFDRLGFLYNTEEFGEVKMVNLRFCLESDGISMPGTAFIVVPLGVKRIKKSANAFTS